jgi:hypothetical protein
MAVILETSLGDIFVELYTEKCPKVPNDILVCIPWDFYFARRLICLYFLPD